MNKKETTIIWSIIEDEGYWYYLFGEKSQPLVKSGKFMTKVQAQKALSSQLEQAKQKI